MKTKMIAVAAGMLAGVVLAAPVLAQNNVSGTYGEVIVNGDTQTSTNTSAVVLRPKSGSARPSLVAQTGTSDKNSGFIIFNAANEELFRVRGDGVIALGGPGFAWGAALSPTIEYKNTSLSFGDSTDIMFTSNAWSDWDSLWKLKSAGPAANYYMYNGEHHFRTGIAAAADTYVSYMVGATNIPKQWRDPMMIANNGNVGIGNIAARAPGPQARLHIEGENSNGFGFRVRDLGFNEAPSKDGMVLEMLGNSKILVSNLEIGSVTVPQISSVGAALKLNSRASQDVEIGETGHTSRLVVKGSGKSTFAGAVDITGNLNVTGDIQGAKVLNAVYQDIAEWVPTAEPLAAGTVVIVDPNSVNRVVASDGAYDMRVAGVVSARPGVVLGVAAEDKVKVATTGRVRVRVDATGGAITIGDLLVTSDRKGVAMKSTPVDVGGVSIHRPGTLIGKALEPLASGEGEILVLLSLQ